MTRWRSYQAPPTIVLGFHGTDTLNVRQVILQDPEGHLKFAKKKFEWLGHGVYFWENDPVRALEWAEEKKHPNPDVVGGVIELGECLDLTTRKGCEEVLIAFQRIKDIFQSTGKELSINSGGIDLKRRELDCQVIMSLHEFRQEAKLTPYDSIRAAFSEERLYPGAGFSAKGHIQICIRNPKKCIKGYFKPL